MDYMDPDVRCSPKDCSTYSLTHALFQCMVIGLHSTGEARTLELVDSQGHDGFPSNSFWMVYRPNKHRPFWITWAGHVTVLTTQQQMLAQWPSGFMLLPCVQMMMIMINYDYSKSIINQRRSRNLKTFSWMKGLNFDWYFIKICS